MRTCKIKMIWEEDTWIAELDDEAFDLVLESDSYDGLVERVKVAIQDILEVDFAYRGDIQFIFLSERVDSVRAKAS